MDLVDPYILVTAIVAVVLGLLYWFKFRDDGAWDRNATLKLSDVNYEDLRSKVDVKEVRRPWSSFFPYIISIKCGCEAFALRSCAVAFSHFCSFS